MRLQQLHIAPLGHLLSSVFALLLQLSAFTLYISAPPITFLQNSKSLVFLIPVHLLPFRTGLADIVRLQTSSSIRTNIVPSLKMRHRPQPLLPLSAAAGFLFDIKDEDQLPANSQSQYSLTAPSSAAQFQSCPPNITYQSSADPSTVYTRSAAFSAAMFRLGSRSKSSQASAALYSTNQGGIGVSEIPYQPTSGAPASQDPLRVQGQFSPRGSSDSQSSTSLSVVTRRRQSTGVFHKRGLSPTTSAYTTTTAATYSMARSTRSGLLGRGRKHLNVAEEFDPTTFRKNRSRPAVAARGQDAVYQEYDDLFEEEEDEVNSYADGEVSQTDVSGDEKRSHLLQADGATSVRDNSPERLQVPPKTQRKAQRPDNLNLELLASAFPSVGGVAIAASTAPPQTPPESWPRSPHMTTPPRSTAPSVEETMDPRLPMTAPPTPPPKSASLLSLDTNVNDRPVTTVKHDQLSSRRTMPSVTRVNGRKFGERTSSMGAASMVSIGRSPSSEGLNFVNIPSPTLFVYPGWSARSDGSGNAHAPQPGAWALNANSVMQTPPAFAESSSNIYMMTMLLDEAEGSVSDLDEASVSPKSSSRSISLDETNAGTKLHLNIEDNNYEDTPEATEISADEFLHIKNRSESRNPSLASSTGFRPSLIEPGEESNHKKEAFEPTSEAGVSITPVPAEQKIGKRRRGSNREIKDSSSEREDMVEGGPKPDPAYLRAFRAFVKASANNDAFISRAPRFDAIQAHRICSNLRDDCPLQASCPPKARRLSNATRSPIDSRARQREASEEIMTSLWALMAGRWLNFGKMIVSPAHEQLIATCMKSRRRRGASKRDSGITQMFAEAGVLKHSVANEKRRVLDLGGAPVGMFSKVVNITSISPY